MSTDLAQLTASHQSHLPLAPQMQYNGAAVICMAGKKCVGIASDRRYGLRNQTISCEMQKTFQVNDRTLCGMTGLATDMQTLEQKFVFRNNMYRLREERDMLLLGGISVSYERVMAARAPFAPLDEVYA